MLHAVVWKSLSFLKIMLTFSIMLLSVDTLIHGLIKDTDCLKYDNFSQNHGIKDVFPVVLNIIPIANYLECYDRFLCVEMLHFF